MSKRQAEEIERLRAAAAPFIAFAEAFEGHGEDVLILRRPGVGQILVGDFRRLAAAIEPQEG